MGAGDNGGREDRSIDPLTSSLAIHLGPNKGGPMDDGGATAGAPLIAARKLEPRNPLREPDAPDDMELPRSSHIGVPHSEGCLVGMLRFCRHTDDCSQDWIDPWQDSQDQSMIKSQIRTRIFKLPQESFQARD